MPTFEIRDCSKRQHYSVCYDHKARYISQLADKTLDLAWFDRNTVSCYFSDLKQPNKVTRSRIVPPCHSQNQIMQKSHNPQPSKNLEVKNEEKFPRSHRQTSVLNLLSKFFEAATRWRSSDETVFADLSTDVAGMQARWLCEICGPWEIVLASSRTCYISIIEKNSCKVFFVVNFLEVQRAYTVFPGFCRLMGNMSVCRPGFQWKYEDRTPK